MFTRKIGKFPYKCHTFWSNFQYSRHSSMVRTLGIPVFLTPDRQGNTERCLLTDRHVPQPLRLGQWKIINCGEGGSPVWFPPCWVYIWKLYWAMPDWAPLVLVLKKFFFLRTQDSILGPVNSGIIQVWRLTSWANNSSHKWSLKLVVLHNTS